MVAWTPNDRAQRADQMIGARFRRGVRARGVVSRLFVELARFVQREVTEHFVGGDVMVTLAMFARGLEQHVGTDEVGVDERPGVVERVVVVRLGGEVHDDVRVIDQGEHQVPIADVSVLESNPIDARGEVHLVTGVGQRIEDGDLVLRTVCQRVVNEVGADESGASGDEHSHASLLPADPDFGIVAQHEAVGRRFQRHAIDLHVLADQAVRDASTEVVDL